MDPYYLRPVFEKTYLKSIEMYEFRYIFHEECENKGYPKSISAYLGQYGFTKSIVVNAMLLRHYQTIEELSYYPLASEIAEIDTNQFMEVELEDELYEQFKN